MIHWIHSCVAQKQCCQKPSCYASQQTSKAGARSVNNHTFDLIDPQLSVEPDVSNALQLATCIDMLCISVKKILTWSGPDWCDSFLLLYPNKSSAPSGRGARRHESKGTKLLDVAI